MSLVNDTRLLISHHRLADALRRLGRVLRAQEAASMVVPLDEPRLMLSDCSGIIERGAAHLQLTRPVETGNAMEDCAPGARLGFVTTSRRVDFVVRFQRFGRFMNPGCSIGAVLVDGRPHASFMGRESPAPDVVAVRLPQGRHHVELVWPYGRGMTLLGLRLSRGAVLESPPARPARKLILIGDSITQGLTGAGITRTWPFLLAQSLPAEVVNLGFSSRRANAADGAIAGSIAASAAVYMIGVGDYYHQTDIGEFSAAAAGFMAAFRQAAPKTPLLVVTALHAETRPARTLRWSLDDYRCALRDAAVAVGAAVLDGTQCMRADRSRLRRDKVHLNDLGSAEVARSVKDRLSALLAIQEWSG